MCIISFHPSTSFCGALCLNGHLFPGPKRPMSWWVIAESRPVVFTGVPLSQGLAFCPHVAQMAKKEGLVTQRGPCLCSKQLLPGVSTVPRNFGVGGELCKNKSRCFL